MKQILFALALVGATACHKSKPATTTPANTSASPSPETKADTSQTKPATTTDMTKPGNPCAGQ